MRQHSQECGDKVTALHLFAFEIKSADFVCALQRIRPPVGELIVKLFNFKLQLHYVNSTSMNEYPVNLLSSKTFFTFSEKKNLKL